MSQSAQQCQTARFAYDARGGKTIFGGLMDAAFRLGAGVVAFAGRQPATCWVAALCAANGQG